uniref:Uncharacterized protein n=1 Tax=Lactuca sativa TaxID=4236 RepID=A0A9R1XEG3_LACSA|nr:hypothetical protein LSAT_V11C400158430 [Lactuca sativa]
MGYSDMRFHLQKIEEHLIPIEPSVDSKHTYTTHEFVYAFKIWIMETFPNSSIIGSSIPGVIPRTVAYPRMRRLHVVDCVCILDVRNVYSSTSTVGEAS